MRKYFKIITSFVLAATMLFSTSAAAFADSGVEYLRAFVDEEEIFSGTSTISFTWIGQTIPLDVYAYPDGFWPSLEFSSSDENVVTIDEDGIMTAEGEGEAQVSVKDADSEADTEMTFNVSVVDEGQPEDPEPEVESILFKEDSHTFTELGETYQYSVDIYPEEAANLVDPVISIDDPTIASVDDNLVVTALKKGETYISYYDRVSGNSASADIIVDVPGEDDGPVYVNSLTPSEDVITLTEIGQTYEISVTPDPENAELDGTWNSYNTNVVKIQNTDGLTNTITAVGEGQTTVDYFDNNTGNGADFVVKVVLDHSGDEPEEPTPTPTPSPAKPADDDKKEETTPKTTDKPKTADKPKTTGNTSSVKNTTVKAKSVSIKASALRVAAGKKVTLKASVSPSNTTNKKIKWTSSNKKYATVSNTGVVTTKKAGAGKSVTITASATDGSKVKKAVTIKIKKVPVKKIKLSAKKKSVKVGKKLAIKAKITPKNATVTKLKWKVSNKKYASITQKGVLKAKKAGKGKTVKVTATARDGSKKKATIKIKIK